MCGNLEMKTYSLTSALVFSLASIVFWIFSNSNLSFSAWSIFAFLSACNPSLSSSNAATVSSSFAERKIDYLSTRWCKESLKKMFTSNFVKFFIQFFLFFWRNILHKLDMALDFTSFCIQILKISLLKVTWWRSRAIFILKSRKSPKFNIFMEIFYLKSWVLVLDFGNLNFDFFSDCINRLLVIGQLSFLAGNFFLKIFCSVDSRWPYFTMTPNDLISPWPLTDL